MIDSVRIHRVWSEEGRIYKERRLGMGMMIAAGNVFLRLSRSRIVMFPFTAHWRAWELHCFSLVNGDAFACGSHGARAIWTERIPGTSLFDHAARRTLDEAMLRATGAELARAHALHSKARGGPWSHGDPHLKNVLWDAAGGRARLIDFETAHDDGLEPIARHADDLLVLTLDLLGRTEEHAPRFVRALLEGYDRREVAAALKARLVVPRGLELVLWHTRSNFVATEVLAARIEALRAAL
jgi:hypothetical protein